MTTEIVALRNVTKFFGRTQAIADVSIHVAEGEVVGLIGDNGAGKSTLIKILAGAIRPTSGAIVVRGQRVAVWDPARSRGAGIETVFQDRALALQQSIMRNIFMGRELVGPFGWLRLGQEIAEAERLMREMGFSSRNFTPHTLVGELSGGERQGVAMARAVYNRSDLIVLDEPTTALSLTETAKVLNFMRQVRSNGRSILFISHNVNHVYDVADRIVLLDRGRIAFDARRSDIPSPDALIRSMEMVARPVAAHHKHAE